MAHYNHNESLTENALRGVDITEPVEKRYFTVYLETISGSKARTKIDRGGEALELPDKEDMGEEVVLNVIAVEYDGQGLFQNMREYDAYKKDLDEVLNQVEADHDPSEWDNFDW